MAKEKYNFALVKIPFVRGKYNISDGLGGRRGAAYYPLHGGDIFFDDAEEWSLVAYDSNKSIFSRETNLMKVAIHELGHALGLEHSKITLKSESDRRGEAGC